MSRPKLGILAVSVLALGVGFAGVDQASAFSSNSPIILAQAGGPGGGGGAGGGAGGTGDSSGGPGQGAGQSTFGGAADGPLAPDGTPPAAQTSPSPGAPRTAVECANLPDPIQRSECMDRLNRGATPPVRQ